MSQISAVLCVDLGSSSGRVIAAKLDDGKINTTEVFRFVHGIDEQDGSLHWRPQVILENTVEGLKKGLDVLGLPASEVCVTIDTWGVDHALLDSNDELVIPNFVYRDERTERTADKFYDRLSKQEGWSLTGIQPATINTANQLFALYKETPKLAERTKQVLFTPDWVSWYLTGIKGWSKSIASTSALCTPGANGWSGEVFSKLGIDSSLVGELSEEMTIIGKVRGGLGLDGLTIVRGGAHDTACAVHSMGISSGEPSAFISCGSWSVLGIIGDKAQLSEEALNAGVSNEVCTDGRIRTLVNLTGLWLIQQAQVQWEKEGLETDIVELVDIARKSSPSGIVIDVQDSRLNAPENMVTAIRELAQEQNIQMVAQGDICRLIFESIAAAHAKYIKELEAISGQIIEQVYLVGGGSKNELICQWTADALGKDVIAGPAESASLGAALASLQAVGKIEEAELKTIIDKSADRKVYQPT